MRWWHDADARRAAPVAEQQQRGYTAEGERRQGAAKTRPWQESTGGVGAWPVTCRGRPGQLSVSEMSDQSDSQNRSEEQQNLSKGTSPSNKSYDEGSRSTPSNLPKVATRHRRKRNSDSEDEDFVVDEEVTSKKLVKKQQVAAAAAGIKPGMKSDDDEAVGDGKKRKKARTTTAKVLGYPSMRKSDDEEDEEDARPAPKAQKLMGDAIKSRAAPSKPKTASKQSSQAQAPKQTTPKRSTRNIPATEKNKAPVPELQEEEEPQVLRKLKPKIPEHDDNHPIAET
nr:nucleolin-like [Aegilops tauschii subsp. strangulata]